MQRLVFAAIMAVAIYLGARGITDEAAVMLGGDMSRYAMNGVYMYDLISSGGVWNADDLVAHAELYFARYPALSLGHHPPLPSIALLPFYAIFGVSMVAARLSALVFFTLAVWQLYALGKRLLGWQVASWATLLFITNVFVLRFGQYVLSEMPMLALVLTSLNALCGYCETGQKKYYAWFVLAAAASLYAKQLAIFMFPMYALILVARFGWRHLQERHLIAWTLVGAVLVAPLVAITLRLSPSNVALATKNIRNLGNDRGVTVWDIVTTIITTHLSLPLALVVIAGALGLAVRRERLGLFGLLWLLLSIGGSVLFAGPFEPARYAFSAMPAYVLIAASLAAVPSSRRVAAAVVIVLGAAVLWQAWLIRNLYPSGAGGYEAAASYVVDHSASPTVLLDTSIDTGYFVFFVRKHDEKRRLVVLRAEKLLDTRNEEDPGDPAEFYARLREFGIQFVVLEESRSGPPTLLQMRSELKSDRFEERRRIPIESRDGAVSGLDLVIYEFKDAQPPDLDAKLNVSARRRTWSLRLRDLLEPNAGLRQ